MSKSIVAISFCAAVGLTAYFTGSAYTMFTFLLLGEILESCDD